MTQMPRNGFAMRRRHSVTQMMAKCLRRSYRILIKKQLTFFAGRYRSGRKNCKIFCAVSLDLISGSFVNWNRLNGAGPGELYDCESRATARRLSLARSLKYAAPCPPRTSIARPLLSNQMSDHGGLRCSAPVGDTE